MSFWRTFGFHTVSAIETILEGQDFSLEQLLDEDEILQETKAQNKKLIDFLVEHDTLKKLIDYITKEPADDADSTKKFKYPFLCCEILASEVWAICDALCQFHDLLDALFGFLDREPPLNSLLTSYTCRVVAVLLQKKSADVLGYMKEKPNLVGNFIRHLGNASVMDLLLKIIQNDDNIGGQGTLEWLSKTDLIPSLVSKFDPKLSDDVHENASQALCDIIAVSSNNPSSPLMSQLESEDVIRPLMGSILAEGGDSSLVHGLAVIIQLLRRHAQPVYDKTTTIEQLSPFLKVIVSNLDQLHVPISPSAKAKERGKLTLTFGTIEPLGLPRLRTVEFFSAMFRLNLKSIEDLLMKMGVLNSCLELFFMYQWNNFLHQIEEQILQGIFEGENDDLKISVIVDCKLPEKICEAHKLNEEDLAKPKGMRRGYMGYITIIATNLNNMAAAIPAIGKLLAENAAWQEYSRGPLALIQDKEAHHTAAVSEPSQGYDETEELDEDFENGGVVFESNTEFSSGQTLHLEDDSDEEEDDSVFERRVEEEEETTEITETTEVSSTEKETTIVESEGRTSEEVNNVTEKIKETTV